MTDHIRVLSWLHRKLRNSYHQYIAIVRFYYRELASYIAIANQVAHSNSHKLKLLISDYSDSKEPENDVIHWQAESLTNLTCTSFFTGFSFFYFYRAPFS